MNPDNLTDPSLTGDAHVTSAGGGATVDSSTLTLAEVNTYLGKDFKDKESALKALKDTQSFVGKRVEDIEAGVRAQLVSAPQSQSAAAADSSLASEVRQLKHQVFFGENPQYKGYQDVIAKMGSDPAEVVRSPEFTKVFEAGKVADEVAKTKSVVASNGRVGAGSNVTQEAVKIANATGSTERTAEALARGIIEEMNG